MNVLATDDVLDQALVRFHAFSIGISLIVLIAVMPCITRDNAGRNGINQIFRNLPIEESILKTNQWN